MAPATIVVMFSQDAGPGGKQVPIIVMTVGTRLIICLRGIIIRIKCYRFKRISVVMEMVIKWSMTINTFANLEMDMT